MEYLQELEEMGYKIEFNEEKIIIKYPEEIPLEDFFKHVKRYYGGVDIKLDFFLGDIILYIEDKKDRIKITPRDLLTKSIGDREFYFLKNLAENDNKNKKFKYLTKIEPSNLSWKDLPGFPENVKEYLEGFIYWLENGEKAFEIREKTRKNPSKTRNYNILLYGPPGTGKSTSVKILASLHNNISFYYLNLSDVRSMWYGESEKNLRKAFEELKRVSKKEPSILVIDEIDNIGIRDDRHLPERSFVSTFLQCLEGVLNYEDVTLIGITNLLEILDMALLSRFTIKLEVPIPNKKERKEIWKYYAKHLSEEDIELLASSSEGLCGRDIESICTLAELISIRENKLPSLENYIRELKRYPNKICK